MRSTAARAASTAGRCRSSGSRSAAAPAGSAPGPRRGSALPSRRRDRRPGGRRRAECERALVVDAARARRGEPAQVGNGPGAPFLREADQPQENLCGRLGVGQRAVARPRRGPEEVRQGAQTRPCDPAGQQASRKPDGVDRPARRAGGPRRARPPGRESRCRSARCARRERAPDAKSRKRWTACTGDGAPARSRSSIPVSEATTAGSGTPGSTSVWNVPACVRPSSRTAPISQIAATAGPKAGRLEVDDDVASRFERQLLRRVVRERDRGPRHASRESPLTTSSRRLCASPAGAKASAKRRAGRLLRGERARAAPRPARPAGRRRRR